VLLGERDYEPLNFGPTGQRPDFSGTSFKGTGKRPGLDRWGQKGSEKPAHVEPPTGLPDERCDFLDDEEFMDGIMQDIYNQDFFGNRDAFYRVVEEAKDYTRAYAKSDPELKEPTLVAIFNTQLAHLLANQEDDYPPAEEE
jgi:hypothetical protein